jgi:hypothetical protein
MNIGSTYSGGGGGGGGGGEQEGEGEEENDEMKYFLSADSKKYNIYDVGVPVEEKRFQLLVNNSKWY